MGNRRHLHSSEREHGSYRKAGNTNRLLRKEAKRIGGDLSLPYADRKGNGDVTSGDQTFIIRLVWGNGYAQVVNGATRGDELLDVYLLRPESLVNSYITEQGISDHCGICKIWGFHGGNYEECCHLRCYAVWLLLEPKIRRNLGLPSSRWQESVK
jgi:hypothetical protein